MRPSVSLVCVTRLSREWNLKESACDCRRALKGEQRDVSYLFAAILLAYDARRLTSCTLLRQSMRGDNSVASSRV